MVTELAIMKLKFTAKIANSRFVPLLGDLGVMYAVHLRLVGKRVIDFILARIELFSLGLRLRLRRYEQILVEIALFERGWVTLSATFRGNGCRPPTNFGVRKLESVGYHVVLYA